MCDSSNWLSGAVIGAIIGAVLTGILQLWRDHVLNKRLGRSITQAIVAEISATMQLIQQRHYMERLSELKPPAENDQAGKIRPISVVFPKEPFPVYAANVDKIGLVPAAIRKDVVKFYQLVQAAICDVRSDGGTFASREVYTGELRELIAILDCGLKSGEWIEKWYYASWWQRLLLHWCPLNVASGNHL
jgi:hypothetical protein